MGHVAHIPHRGTCPHPPHKRCCRGPPELLVQGPHPPPSDIPRGGEGYAEDLTPSRTVRPFEMRVSGSIPVPLTRITLALLGIRQPGKLGFC